MRNKKSILLKQFIEIGGHQQNPPLTSTNFISYCEKRGIRVTEDDLESYEKEKLLFPLARLKRQAITSMRHYFRNTAGEEVFCYTDDLQPGVNILRTEPEVEYISYDIFKTDPFTTKYLLELVDKEVLYDPLDYPFAEWSSFKDTHKDIHERNTISYYATYDLHQLRTIKKKIHVSVEDNIRDKKIRSFMLLTQNALYPYGTLGGNQITCKGDNDIWNKNIRGLDLDKILQELDLEEVDLLIAYSTFASIAKKVLGVGFGDWMQLWKGISWAKKDKLSGRVRLGIEYLQWALIIKKALEFHFQREILDVDELDVAAENIMQIDVNNPPVARELLRHIRNERYSDNKVNYYHDIYKRRYYLANDFKLDYQPRVTVFVEGKTEIATFPTLFKFLFGIAHESIGIQFINLAGISNFFGKKINIKESNAYKKQFISNFAHLVSYNLSQWQTIPFVIGDNENAIDSLLNKEHCISFADESYSFPHEWRHLWGITNCDSGFKGKDFEMVNFSDDELASAINSVHGSNLTSTEIGIVRALGNGIKQVNIGEGVDIDKVRVGKFLVKLLTEKSQNDDTIFDRPIFQVLDVICKTAVRNYPPTDRVTELKNHEYLLDLLEKTKKTHPS